MIYEEAYLGCALCWLVVPVIRPHGILTPTNMPGPNIEITSLQNICGSFHELHISPTLKQKSPVVLKQPVTAPHVRKGPCGYV